MVKENLYKNWGPNNLNSQNNFINNENNLLLAILNKASKNCV